MSAYCFSDIHGCYGLWQQIKEYCKPDDIIYFLGDACDRVDDGILIMSELLKDERVVYLKGNHEDIFTIVGSEILEGVTDNIGWWLSNGGQPTLDTFLKLPDDQQQWLLDKIKGLPKTMTYVNKDGKEIFLSHAGGRPDLTEYQMELLGHAKDPYIWDRKHINCPWPRNIKYEDVYMIHGHTPVQIITHKNDCSILNYCDGHKFDIDLASFASCKTALFNLDTLEVEKYFFDEKMFKETCLCD